MSRRPRKPDIPPLVSLANQVEAHIERLIFTGQLRSGQRLSEPEIASWFGTSRAPVREALRRLAQTGLVSIEARRGASVKMPSRDEIEDLMAIREALEGLAARLAAERATVGDLARLEAVIDAEWLARDNIAVKPANFHEALVAAAHSDALEAGIRGAFNLFRMLQVISAGAGRVPHSLDEHAAILAAVKARDPEGAERAARIHVRNVRDWVRRYLDASTGEVVELAIPRRPTVPLSLKTGQSGHG